MMNDLIENYDYPSVVYWFRDVVTLIGILFVAIVVNNISMELLFLKVKVVG